MRTLVTVHGERAADFETVFGTATVPVTGWLPTVALLPGHEEAKAVFELDLDWVREAGHRGALVLFLMERFGQSRAFVDRELEETGVPILARDCTVESDGRDFL